MNLYWKLNTSSTEKSFGQYIFQEDITTKYRTQIHLQMFVAKTKMNLFCVEDPNFEENKKITLIWVKNILMTTLLSN